jgi:hypothetical protein
MSTLCHCIYASEATAEFQERQIPSLLEKIRAANSSRGITGMLLYVEGSFFQVLEGHSRLVDDVFAAIKRDPRHARITMIIREPIVERRFGEWTMGFSTLALADVGKILEKNDYFASSSCIAELTSGRAKKLLAAFHDGRWRTGLMGAHQGRVP